MSDAYEGTPWSESIASASSSSSSSSSIASSGFRLTFTQGFLAGQLSIIVVALIVIRYVIFEDSRASAIQKSRSARVRTSSHVENTRKARRSLANKDGVNVDIAEIMGTILDKVQYEIDSHSGESIDWINVVFAQALAGYREDLLAGGWSATSREDDVQKTAREWMEDVLNARTIGRGINFLDPIEVTHVTFGDSYPIFTNARVRPADDTGRLRVEVDIDYSDCVALSIETKLVINFPRPRFAVLPISLGLTIERFSGTLAIELFSSEPSAVLPLSNIQTPRRSRHELHFSLHPDFALDASATSLVGSRAKLQDVPKIEQLLVERLRNYVHDRFVWPKYWTLTLPNLVPKNASFQEDNENHQEGMDIAGQGDTLHDDPMHLQSEMAESVYRDDEHENHYHPQYPASHTHQQHFNPLLHSRQHGSPLLPGTLPNVEAWRSQGTNSGLHHRNQPKQAQVPRVPQSFASDTRYRNPASMASSVAYS